MLLNTSQTSFAGIGVFFVVHLNIILRKASDFVILIESAVPSFENIDFREGQLWVLVSVSDTIFITDESCSVDNVSSS